MQMFPALPVPLVHHLRLLVENHGIDPGHAGPRAPGLHRVDRRLGRAEESAVLRLPPRVDDDRFLLADDVVVPLPDVRLDGLADRRHVLEVVVVLRGLVRPGLAEHPDRRRRRVEDVDVEPFGDAPDAARVREVRHAFVDHGRRRQSERPVDDVRVPGDPADVGHAPVDVLRVDVLDVLRSPRDVGEVAARPVLAALGLSGRAARVHEEERRLGVHRDRLDPGAVVILQDLVDEEVAALHHRRGRGVLLRIALPDEDLVDLLAFLLGGRPRRSRRRPCGRSSCRRGSSRPCR